MSAMVLIEPGEVPNGQLVEGLGIEFRKYGGGEAGFLFPFRKSTPAYRTLHHTLIKHREMMMPIL
jgi:hypothetical protein